MLRLAACVILILSVSAIAQAAVTTCGKLLNTKTAYSAPLLPITTELMEFRSVPGARIAFTVAGKEKSCVVVDFAGRMKAGMPGNLWLRVMLDGKSVAQPGALVATSDDLSELAEAHGFTFVFPAVKPGKHVVEVQFRSENGSLVLIEQNTMVVRYR